MKGRTCSAHECCWDFGYSWSLNARLQASPSFTHKTDSHVHERYILGKYWCHPHLVAVVIMFMELSNASPSHLWTRFIFCMHAARLLLC